MGPPGTRARLMARPAASIGIARPRGGGSARIPPSPPLPPGPGGSSWPLPCPSGSPRAVLRVVRQRVALQVLRWGASGQKHGRRSAAAPRDRTRFCFFASPTSTGGSGQSAAAGATRQLCDCLQGVGGRRKRALQHESRHTCGRPSLLRQLLPCQVGSTRSGCLVPLQRCPSSQPSPNRPPLHVFYIPARSRRRRFVRQVSAVSAPPARLLSFTARLVSWQGRPSSDLSPRLARLSFVSAV